MTGHGDESGDDERLAGRLHGEQPRAAAEPMPLRIAYMLLIWLMLRVADTILTLATLVQAILMLAQGGKPNPRIAEFGTDLGVWIAKAARFQTGASEVKPWPWTELD
jgi:hypothetical protein